MRDLYMVSFKEGVQIGPFNITATNNVKYKLKITEDWKFVIVTDKEVDVFVPIENVKHFTFVPEEKKEDKKEPAKAKK